MDRLGLVQHLFDESAERYTRDIAPLFAPLVADFVAYAAPLRRDRVLDVGTGTGLVAQMIAPYVRLVIGVDISPRSLAVARLIPNATHVHFVRADLNRLPSAAGTFSLVTSSFGLNATEPERSLRALRRVIAPGGRLVLQEWGPSAAYDRRIDELFDQHSADDPGPRVAALRESLDANPARWRDQLQDADDYAEWLTDLGFTVEDVRECSPVSIRMANTEVYLTSRLAWTYRFEEVRAMDDLNRAAFLAGARACLADVAQPDGSFIWQPVLFRVTARYE
jgi:ubiquinone/menaquinone biosynthesis C-methylase UbiE